MFSQLNVNQRIIVDEDMIVNNSPLKLKIAFLNQEIYPDGKNGYYKLLIWLVGTEPVTHFDFKLFLKSVNQQIAIPVENLQPNFQPNDEYYLVAKIPSKNFDFDFDELTYSFNHDQLFKGKGKILLDLKTVVDYQIDNELIFYENQQSQNLIVRYLVWDTPKFYFNQHYQKLLRINYETEDLSYQVNLDPVKSLAELVKNNTWSTPFEFLKFSITAENSDKKSYSFEPVIDPIKEKNFFQVNLLNQLLLNNQGQIIEGGLVPGLLFNPLIEGEQVVNLDFQLFGRHYSFDYWLNIPKFELNPQFKGEWIEAKST